MKANSKSIQSRDDWAGPDLPQVLKKRVLSNFPFKYGFLSRQPLMPEEKMIRLETSEVACAVTQNPTSVDRV
jgi:hypothetical protein